MDLLRFNADDIHELRLELAERRKTMSKEEAELDFKIHVEKMRHAIRKNIPSAVSEYPRDHV